MLIRLLLANDAPMATPPAPTPLPARAVTIEISLASRLMPAPVTIESFEI